LAAFLRGTAVPRRLVATTDRNARYSGFDDLHLSVTISDRPPGVQRQAGHVILPERNPHFCRMFAIGA